MSGRLGLFGGTFDPIHLGHTRMAAAFAAELNLDKVVFIPAGDPYHKEFATQTSAHHRFNMVENAIEGNSLFSVSDCDIKREGKTYTADTLEYFKQEFPETTSLWWLMGSDSLLQLHTWHEFQKLFELANLAIAIRDDFSLEQVHSSLLPLCKLALAHDLDDKQTGTTSGKMRLLKLPPLAVSSNQIRSLAQKNQDITPWVDSKVVQYLQNHHLYQKN